MNGTYKFDNGPYNLTASLDPDNDNEFTLCADNGLEPYCRFTRPQMRAIGIGLLVLAETA